MFPFIWNIPLGITSAFRPSVQLLAKVTIRMDKPIDWSTQGRDAADDLNVVEACYEEITELTQATLSELAPKNPHPILTRIRELRPDRVGARALRHLLRVAKIR